MKYIFFIAAGIAIFSGTASFVKSDENWTPLLDKKLSQWEMYLSFKHKNGFKGEEPKDEKGNPARPVGYNKNLNNVFSVTEENGEPVLKISGEYYGCIFTKKEFENYHLRLKVKWGSKKWEPRLTEDKDSGILYHSQGECGVDYWRSWMLSQEFQIIEKSMGDYWCIANSVINIKAIKPDSTSNFIYNEKGLKAPFGFHTANGHYCQAKGNYEFPSGEWNTLDLITYGDRSLHIVNGKVAMALSGSRYTENGREMPLVKGKIQIQSEAAEVYYKDIKIRPISKLPEEYQSYF
jgi:hypothetical protein